MFIKEEEEDANVIRQEIFSFSDDGVSYVATASWKQEKVVMISSRGVPQQVCIVVPKCKN